MDRGAGRLGWRTSSFGYCATPPCIIRRGRRARLILLPVWNHPFFAFISHPPHPSRLAPFNFPCFFRPAPTAPPPPPPFPAVFGSAWSLCPALCPAPPPPLLPGPPSILAASALLFHVACLRQGRRSVKLSFFLGKVTTASMVPRDPTAWRIHGIPRTS